MTLLVRSLAFSVLLLLAFAACGTDAALRRRANEEFLSFSDVDITGTEDGIKTETTDSYIELEEIEAEIGEVPYDILEAEPEEEEEKAEPREFLPPPDNYVQEAEDAEELHVLETFAHEYEEAMMRAQEIESQIYYEMENLEDEEGVTNETAEKANDMANSILEEVHEVEEELLQKQDVVPKGEVENFMGFAEDRRRHLMERLKSSGKTKATLNGITYEVEE